MPAETTDAGHALGRLVADEEIQAVLPGVYALPDHREFLEIRVKALHMYDPDAILMGKISRAALVLAGSWRWLRCRRW